MPTAYTEPVQLGKITNFKEYAMLCARSFGACVTMRENSFNTPTLNELQPSNYHLEQIEQIQKDLENLKSLSDEECEQQALNMYNTQLNEYNNFVKENSLYKQRYENMLKKARRYKPPTKDHINYAEFLIKQLEDSMEWDCEINMGIPIKKDGQAWFNNRMKHLNRDLEYHLEKHKKEIERTNSRNEWIRKLKQSLEEIDD